jgi:type II restriction enzyme
MKSVDKPMELVTTKEATLLGFISQSEAKIAKSRAFKLAIDRALEKMNPNINLDEIFSDKDLKSFFLGASCLSAKSINYFSESEQKEMISNVIDLSRIADNGYLMELTARCYLTAGDSLGGSMRNLVGQIAQQKFTEAVVAVLNSNGSLVNVETNLSGKVIAIEWSDYRMIFDKKPRFINKSVDFIVHTRSTTIDDPLGFIACGELKGGIDPAGADEHWKTAKSALDRIHNVFVERDLPTPGLYFVAAAIEASMAQEIFDHLQSGYLAAAANLNNEAQLIELINLLTISD